MEEFIIEVFKSSSAPEIAYKRCEGLFRLQRLTDPLIFNKACKIALENNITTYSFINNIISNNCVNTHKSVTKPLPSHENIRGKEAYN